MPLLMVIFTKKVNLLQNYVWYHNIAGDAVMTSESISKYEDLC